jgi:hypothetical protein
MGYRIFYSDTARFYQREFKTPEQALKGANGSNFSLYRYAEEGRYRDEEGRKVELVGFWTPTTGYVQF